jgi:hypothetical protein
MIVYDVAPQEAHDLLLEARTKWHPELEKVRIGMIVASSRNKDGSINGNPPIKAYGGHACAAQVKLVPAKDRIHKNLDAEIMIDGDSWPTWSAATKLATIDHELEHIVVTNAEDDEADHPKLKLRPDAWASWGLLFRYIASW